MTGETAPPHSEELDAASRLGELLVPVRCIIVGPGLAPSDDFVGWTETAQRLKTGFATAFEEVLEGPRVRAIVTR